MNIKDFAKGRGVDPQAVSRYINRHRAEFDGLTSKDGQKVILSPAAIERLERAYPLPSPIQVIEDTESRRELIKTQRLVIQLQTQLMDQAALIAEAKAKTYLLEQRETELSRQQEQIEEQRVQIQGKDAELQQLRQQLQDTQAQLQQSEERRESMANSSLLQRILKRGW